ncbi:hypothetical protein [Chryseobacterium sp.]|uniref:hypothetical protein n=1 Tax=Chryseobacterium sp. TaxID=1871047 RepID=UPI00388F9D40
MNKILFSLLTLFFVSAFSQQKISGLVTSEDFTSINSVFVLNVNSQKSVITDYSGRFSIEVKLNDEIRFVKEGYYRTDRIVTQEDINSLMKVMILRAETLIPEVKINIKPTGDLKKDSEHYNDSKKVASMKTHVYDYIKAGLKDPLPRNDAPKTFQGNDFSAVNVDIIAVVATAIGLIDKASQPKITTPDFYESQDFLNKIKTEINLSFLTKYGMNEERIDHFLLYTEKINHLSKRFRKNFKKEEITMILMGSFNQYKKNHKISS